MAEEVALRGSITGGLWPRIGVGWAPVIRSAVLALAHILSVGGPILRLGPSHSVAGLALVCQWTRSLYRRMVLHASFNLVAVILIFLTSTAGNCC